MKFFLALLLITSLTGCAGLLIAPEDSRLTKAGKVAARIPVALVSVGLSEFLYRCEQETDRPSWFFERRVPAGLGLSGEYWGDNAEYDWAYLTPQARIFECWTQAQAYGSGQRLRWNGPVLQAKEGYDPSGHAFRPWDWGMDDTTHHLWGHEHHHGHDPC